MTRNMGLKVERILGVVGPLLLAAGALLVAASYALPNPPYGGTLLMRVPLSGAAWVDPDDPPKPSQQPPPPPKGDDRLQRIEEKLDRLIKLLEDAAGPDDRPAERDRERERPRGEARDPKDLVAALGACAGCHNQADARKKGDGLVLFRPEGRDPNVFRDDLTARELRKMVREVSEGTMPKRPSRPLTREQRADLLDELNARLDRAERR